MKKIQGLKKTSVSVEPELWKRFGANLRLNDLELSVGLNALIRGYVEQPDVVFISPDGKLTIVETKDALDDSSRRSPKRKSNAIPQNNDEEILVAALLLLLRDKREIAQVPKEGVKLLLTNWVEKGKEFRRGEKSA